MSARPGHSTKPPNLPPNRPSRTTKANFYQKTPFLFCSCCRQQANSNWRLTDLATKLLVGDISTNFDLFLLKYKLRFILMFLHEKDPSPFLNFKILLNKFFSLILKKRKCSAICSSQMTLNNWILSERGIKNFSLMVLWFPNPSWKVIFLLCFSFYIHVFKIVLNGERCSGK